MSARGVHAVAEALRSQNVGLAVFTTRVEFSTESGAMFAKEQLKDANIRAVAEAEPTRLGVVYGALLVSVVARVIVACHGTVLPKTSGRSGRRIAPPAAEPARPRDELENFRLGLEKFRAS